MLAGRLRRITRDGRWVPEIDGLRSFAIAAVILFHLWEELTPPSLHAIPVENGYWWLGRALTNGDRGVPLFFAISGMILALPFGRWLLLGQHPVSLSKYYLRRVTRLEPPYLLSILLVVLMEGLYRAYKPGYLWHALASSLYLHNLWFGQKSSINGVYWSLEVEIQFYLLAPLIMQVFRIRGKTWRRAFLLSVVLATSILQIPYLESARFQLSILANLQHFTAGLLVADVFLLDLRKTVPALLWDVAGFGSLFAILWMPQAHTPYVVLPFLEAILCLAALRGGLLRTVCSNRRVAIFGGMCYSIYLLHFIFIAAIFKTTAHALTPRLDFLGNFLTQTVITVIPALIFCVVFFVLVERPCMDPNWPAKLAARLGNGGRAPESVGSA